MPDWIPNTNHHPNPSHNTNLISSHNPTTDHNLNSDPNTNLLTLTRDASLILSGGIDSVR